jgi:hypothetical protein
MSTVLVRVEKKTHEVLRDLAKRTKRPIPAVIQKAVDLLEQHEFAQGLYDDFKRLRDEREGLDEYRAEVGAWDAAVADGLESESWQE